MSRKVVEEKGGPRSLRRCVHLTIERMTKDGRLPPPEYPFENDIPAWRESVLDERDQAAALLLRPSKAERKTARAGEGAAS